MSADVLNALRAAADVFDELDGVSWPQSDRDRFHGEGGRCPVDYAKARAKVAAAIDLLREAGVSEAADGAIAPRRN